MDVKIGLEIHAELKTNTKLFCGCENAFGSSPNVHVCPMCLGLPGAMPVLNSKAVYLAALAGAAFHCDIQNASAFDRKQYSYPDLPKSYQITQYAHPICLNGYVTLKSGKHIRIREIHLEEDAGKLIHEEHMSLIDFNRSGVPLIEIVTMPDLSSPEEARECIETVHEALVFLGITDGKIQEGSVRADVNVSLGNFERIELKNIAGFKETQQVCVYEIARQTEMIAQGVPIHRETRRWNQKERISELMRAKEELPDYRYFPENNLPPLILTDEFIREIKDILPLLPSEKRLMLKDKYGLTEQDAGYLIASDERLAYFEKCVQLGISAGFVLGFLRNDFAAFSAQTALSENDLFCKITPGKLFEAAELILSGDITKENAKKALLISITSGEPIKDIAEAHNLLIQRCDNEELTKAALQLIKNHPDEASAYQNGKKNVFSFFMKEMRGMFPNEAPQRIKEILSSLL